MLLAIANRSAAPIDPESEDWLRGFELLDYDDGGVLAPTERGKIYLSMIESTPLPVAVARWGDPRVFPAVAPLPIVQAAPQSVVTASAPAAAPPAAGETFQLPTGFGPNRWTDLEPGRIPPGFARDAELETILRSKRHLKNFAGSVIWLHRGVPDDVMAYRIIPGDALTVSQPGGA